MARPGVMLYFDMLEPIRVLPDADKGRLLVAILEYGKEGVVPQFDGMLALAWGFVRPKIDMDGESYENTKVQRKYAAFCKKRSGLNLSKIAFEDWLGMDDDERERALIPVNEPQRPVEFVGYRYPTTTPTPTTTTNTTAAVAVTTATGAEAHASAAAERKLKYMNGELGKGVVVLSEYQVDVLLDKLGVDMFDHYVRKLANWVLDNGATVKSHYNTILKWWTEDSGI